MPSEISIPKSWQVAKLGDVLEDIIGGGTPSRDVARYWNGDIPWITVKDMRSRQPESIQEHITKAGVEECATNIIPADTVITATRVGLGKVVRVPYPAAINQDLKALIVGPKLDKSYLEWWILASANHIESIGSGTTVKGIRLNQLKELEIPLAPLPEQRRIVSAIETQLDRLDAAVARLHGAKARLKRYKQAVLKAAVDEAMENGDMVPLEELITSIGQGWSPKCLNSPSPDEEIWGVIKTTAIQPGAYVEEENKELPSPLKPRPEHELKAGDVLVTRAGPRSRVGITCLVRETRPRLMNCDKAYRLRFDAKRVEPAYVEMLLNSPQITDQLDDLKTGISDSGVNLTQGRFLILEMPVIGLKEQRAMIRKTQEATASTAEMEATLDAQLLQSTRLRQAVLKRAFEGRLV